MVTGSRSGTEAPHAHNMYSAQVAKAGAGHRRGCCAVACLRLDMNRCPIPRGLYVAQKVLPGSVQPMRDNVPRRYERRQVIIHFLCQISAHDNDLQGDNGDADCHIRPSAVHCTNFSSS